MRSPERVERALRKGELTSYLENSFDVGPEIGRGGMGAVLSAQDRLLRRSVAVKVLTEGELGERTLRRFVVEAQLGAQLEHPNIVPFYELLATRDGKLAFAMKLVEGQTFSDYLDACAASAAAARSPPHDLHSRLERFLKVCDAVEYAHARGVVHRDLKPDNVMLGVHNEVYVMDWGVARVTSEAEDDPLSVRISPDVGPDVTQVGEIVGTPSYMSPEQARAEPVTPASDQYALGMMLAELSTLTPPRQGLTLQQLTAAAMALPPNLVHRFGEPIPAGLENIVLKATASDPEQRYRSVADFASDVRRFDRDEAVSVFEEPWWMGLWRRLKRRPVVVFGAFSALLLLSSAYVVFSLVRELHTRELAARHAERLSALTARIGQAARNLDARFDGVDLLVESVADTAAEILRRPPGSAQKPLAPADIAATDTAEVVPRYGQRVTFERAVSVRSPDATDADVEPVLSRLSDFEALLARTSARAAAGDEVLSASPLAQHDAARAKSSLLWTDLAFESGIVLVYPGNTFFPTGYDAKKRPWYVAAAAHRSVTWSLPYPDATNGRLVVPCSRAFYDGNGKLAGVAAAHVRLDDVLGLLDFRDVEGYRSAALVDHRGKIVLSTDALGVRVGAGLHGNQTLASHPFPVEGIRDAVERGQRDGRVRKDPELYVFQRLETGERWLVVTVDSARYTFD